MILGPISFTWTQSSATSILHSFFSPFAIIFHVCCVHVEFMVKWSFSMIIIFIILNFGPVANWAVTKAQDKILDFFVVVSSPSSKLKFQHKIIDQYNDLHWMGHLWPKFIVPIFDCIVFIEYQYWLIVIDYDCRVYFHSLLLSIFFHYVVKTDYLGLLYPIFPFFLFIRCSFPLQMLNWV